MRGALERLVEELGIAGDASLVGPLPQEQVREAMAQASVFLLPGRPDPDGRQENQGVVVQEAQAMELPVVASDTGGVREGMEDGRTGFLVPPGDAEATAARLKELIEDPGLRAEMGQRGRTLVRERFNCATLAGELEGMYGNL
jgi:colanic acid/amylovoran biosynthesis glycosyltransferase